MNGHSCGRIVPQIPVFLTLYRWCTTISYISHHPIGGAMQRGLALSRAQRGESERREEERVPLTLFLNQYVHERLQRAVTTNISSTGVYVHRAFQLHRRGT